MNKIAIFASGNGSNTQRICEYFSNHPSVRVGLILSNRPDAFVLERARRLGIPAEVFSREELYKTDKVPLLLEKYEIDFLVLAGFLWLVPANLIEGYSGRIVNIHPALLPKYGGKGMYGHHVHEAVLASGDAESGITIHYIDDHYDEGQIIFQARCPVEPDDTPDTLAARIHILEHRYFPEVIERVLEGMNC
jgi:phosphoribosylglycinamide formyltransferase 1